MSTSSPHWLIQCRRYQSKRLKLREWKARQDTRDEDDALLSMTFREHSQMSASNLMTFCWGCNHNVECCTVLYKRYKHGTGGVIAVPLLSRQRRKSQSWINVCVKGRASMAGQGCDLLMTNYVCDSSPGDLNIEEEKVHCDVNVHDLQKHLNTQFTCRDCCTGSAGILGIFVFLMRMLYWMLMLCCVTHHPFDSWMSAYYLKRTLGWNSNVALGSQDTTLQF